MIIFIEFLFLIAGVSLVASLYCFYRAFKTLWSDDGDNSA